MKANIGAVNYMYGSSKNYKTGTWRTMKPVIDKSKCKRCWLCYTYCPDSSIIKTDSGADVDYDYCKGCGICARECKFGAITMEMEVK